MRPYEKALEELENNKAKVEVDVIAELSEYKDCAKSLKELFRKIDYAQPGLIAEVVHSMYNRHILERVKGDLKPFGCMVKPESLYKLKGKNNESRGV